MLKSLISVTVVLIYYFFSYSYLLAVSANIINTVS